jgi:protoporphyrinogen oxidase
MAPYNEKLLRTPIAALSPSWMGRFIPPARVGEVVRGALRRQNSSAGYNATFHYPLNAGIEALPRALALGLTPPTLNVGLVAVDLSRRQAVLSDGRTVAYDHLLSSAPLPALCRASRGLSASLRRHAALLRATSVTNVNLGLRHKASAPYSWCISRRRDGLPPRGFLSEMRTRVGPPGGSSLYVEVSYQGAKPTPRPWGAR